ncbi:MAG: DNA transposition protein [Rickettsiales bacterium]|nr:DNA transposition protein [Rickettsiales bacterium]|tara:strand:- start:619 stop:1341 length:723 start_codon:yes stop_codon:yes gene_type:complete
MQIQTIAPLKNVSLFNELMDRVMNRPIHLPGMATFHGYSGFGKTFSAVYGANKYKAYYVEVGHSWTQKKFCEAVLNELGGQTKGTIATLVDRIVEILAEEDRPLIIDEFDYVVKRKFVELVREIHDKSNAPIILIGEELLPSKLSEWERFHNRVLDWVPALPADIDDVRNLARLYCPMLDINEDVLKQLHKMSQGRVRRICVNLEKIREYAVTNGGDNVNVSDLNGVQMFTGTPPQRRAV